MIFILLVVVGHFLAALLVYLNHRFVFHTKLGNWPILKDFKQLHLLHHAHAYDNKRNDFIFVPKVYQFTIGLLFLYSAVIVSLPLTIGLASFALLYSYRHYAIHNGDTTSKFYKHHHIHHVNAKYNFSGIYPFIDTIFGTKKK